jgi:serine O-acetyltransferase
MLSKNKLWSIWNEFCSKFKTWVDFDRRGSDISTHCHIPKSTIFRHKGIGVIIGSGVKLGENVQIYQHVTLGGRHKDEFPTIEDDVILFAYCCIIGDITIGKGAVIGAGSIILKDVPPGVVVRGIWS